MTSSSIWDVDRDRFADPPTRLIPRAVCARCRRFDYTPIAELPFPCYHCKAGMFMPRGDFEFHWCPTCDGRDPFCETCHHKRIVAVPIASAPPASATPSGS